MADSIILFCERGEELRPDEITVGLAAEIQEIRAHRSVRGVQVRRNGLAVALLIDFELDQPAAPPVLELRRIEPVALVYSSKEAIGDRVPSIYIDRRDFPDDVPHLNLVLPDEPPSPCISRVGPQALYDRSRVTGILNRLAEWFTDAQLGRLMADGWDPAPVQNDTTISGLVSIDMAAFQEAVARHQNPDSPWYGGWCGRALPGAAHLSVFPFPLFHTNNVPKSDDEAEPAFHVPWLFVHAGREHVDNHLSMPIVSDAASLDSFLTDRGLITAYHDGMRALLAGHLTRPIAIGEHFMCLLLVGFWRPEPLIATLPGLSADPVARRLEVRAFVLTTTMLENLATAPEAVSPARIVTPATGTLHAELSGTAEAGHTVPATLIGAGALGSALLDLLVRSGHTKIRVVDNDRLAPHNLARHEGSLIHLGQAKASVAEQLANTIVEGHDVKGVAKNWAQTTPEDVQDCRVIIDATADVRVQRALSVSPPDGAEAITRTEIYDDGRLGTIFVSAGGNPDLLDLYATLCSLGTTVPAVAEWLHRDAARGSRIDEVTVGLSCSSPTVRLPKATVMQHASAFFPTLSWTLAGSRESGIGLNALSSSFEPAGWQWFPVRPFVTLTIGDDDGWNLRVRVDAIDKMREVCQRSSPRENGGYLYGILDMHRRRIAVVLVSERPDDSSGSAVALRLHPVGSTEQERHIRSRIGRRLQVVGSWHSHPVSSTHPSKTDITTLLRAHEDDVEAGWPTLGLIVGETEMTVALLAAGTRHVKTIVLGELPHS